MKKHLITLAIIFACVASLILAARTLPEEQPQQSAAQENADAARASTQRITGDGVRAAIECKEAVRMTLLSPAHAEFLSSPPTRALGHSRYRVDSYVDASNAFGALLRKRYSCVIREDSNRNWTLEHLYWHS